MFRGGHAPCANSAGNSHYAHIEKNPILAERGQFEMPFFADINHVEEKPHEAFDRWREARRARRKALAHDRAVADVAGNYAASTTVENGYQANA